ncbi:MAG: hypothetical protein LBD08_07560 [Treponema sp.]|nr:hypothetical protein [Treponema sp.]
MKFTSVFILFNAIIVIFLAFVFMVPPLMLGFEEGRAFWRAVWPLALLLALILGGLDAFYVYNRRLLFLLEREDWPALTQYLEQRIFRRGSYASPLVRLLANSYLVLADYPAALALENKAAIANPAAVSRNALIFGSARILSRNYRAAAHFFAEQLEPGKGKRRRRPDRPWLELCQGYALLLDGQYESAEEHLNPLARSSADGLIAGLAAYFLDEYLLRALAGQAYEISSAANEGRERVRKALPQRAAWDKERSNIETEVHGVILSRYLEMAAVWLYGAA